MIFSEYFILNLLSLWAILTHMLEQTQIRGRVWSENIESLDWMRMEDIHYISVVATYSASWIPFSSTEWFTSIHGIDLVWIKSLIDFCIVSSDLFSDVLDVRVKRGAESSTDYHQVVCFMWFWKLWPNRKSNRLSVAYKLKWEAMENREARKQFAFSVLTKFRQLARAFEDIEKNWLLFTSKIISLAAECCGRRRLTVAGDSEKRKPRWN